MSQRHCRRRFLVRVGAVGVSGILAGCNDIQDSDNSKPMSTDETTESSTMTPAPNGRTDPAELEGHVRPEENPATVPGDLSCDRDGFARKDHWINENHLEWGEVTDDEDKPIFGLRVSTLSVGHGESVTITLTNISGSEQTTNNPHKSNLDIYTEEGWQEPRGWEDSTPKPITDDLWGFSPGERHEWQFEMTERGIVEAAYHDKEDGLITCPKLPAGRYRFATAAPKQGDIAVAFDFTG